MAGQAAATAGQQTQQLATGGEGRVPAAADEPVHAGQHPPQAARVLRLKLEPIATLAQLAAALGQLRNRGKVAGHRRIEGRRRWACMAAEYAHDGRRKRSPFCFQDTHALPAPTSSSNAAAGPSERRRLAATPAGGGAARFPETAAGASPFSVSMAGPVVPCTCAGAAPGGSAGRAGSAQKQSQRALGPESAGRQSG